MGTVDTITVGAATNVGMVRKLNEDCYHVGIRLFAVADGMGGHAAGDVASDLAIQSLAVLEAGRVTSDGLRSSVLEANARINAYGADHPESAGLGTTVAGLAVLDGPVPHWAIFHVGDSRAYSFRDGVLRQITVDHSEVQELIAKGQISPEQAATHPSRHVITRAVGQADPPVTDIVVVPVSTGGRFVICSDGLTTEVPDDEIAGILGAHHPPQQTAEQLVRRALERGGNDNVTVLIVDEPAAGTPTPVAGATNPRNVA